MYKILEKKELAPSIHQFTVEANLVANKAKAGQFVIVKIHEQGERIPLTIADFDRDKGTIVVVFQEVGKSTKHLAVLKEGDYLRDFVGPLGHASEIENYGTVVCVAGGVGVAPIFPIARELKNKENRIISILGARNKDLMIWEEELKSVSDEMIIATDDGSKGIKGFVTDVLKDVIEKGNNIGLILAIGPAIMMRETVKVAAVKNIPIRVSLNSIMVDGTGMCGACRVSVGGVTKFACVDGPEFNGYEVDFRELMSRLKFYIPEESVALERWEKAKGDVK